MLYTILPKNASINYKCTYKDKNIVHDTCIEVKIRKRNIVLLLKNVNKTKNIK